LKIYFVGIAALATHLSGFIITQLGFEPITTTQLQLENFFVGIAA
jgi:hypothetical protein